MKRSDIINYLIRKNNYQTYLEIGVCLADENFNKISVKYKVGVDPAPLGGVANFLGTSDEYFKFIHPDTRFDIVFIDGLHQEDQVLRDIENSLKHLSPNGTIVCHDCLPNNEMEQLRDFLYGPWTGDVWRALAKLRIGRTDLDIKVLDIDYGCGIIKRGVNVPFRYDGDGLSYEFYLRNKKELLNVISINEFMKL